jgi:spore maturation protein CgeB
VIKPTLAFFGSSLVSSCRNDVAPYVRGIVRALHERGWAVTFYQPDAHDRQPIRDDPEPEWTRTVVYGGADPDAPARALDEARHADVIVTTSGAGATDAGLEAAVASLRGTGPYCLYWDVDAPATLDRLHAVPDDPLRALVPQFDLVLTHGGGEGVSGAYEALGARRCVDIPAAVDPFAHHPVAPQARFLGDLSLLADRQPDREARVDELFLGAAARLPRHRFRLGGRGWSGKPMPDNVDPIGPVRARDRNAFACSPLAVLDVNRTSSVRYGHAPATRAFEVAGAGACLITDAAAGIERFLEPGRDVLLAESGEEVAAHLAALTPSLAMRIGSAARRRVLQRHTYAHRVAILETLLDVGDTQRLA